MIGKYRMRTDLAMENQEKFERDHVEISGVEIEKKKRKAEIQTTLAHADPEAVCIKSRAGDQHEVELVWP